MSAATEGGQLIEDRKVPLTRMRRAIGRAMSASALVPQFTLQRDVSTAALKHQREGLDPDDRISLSDQLTAAVSRALVLHPRLNATLRPEEKEIVELAAINVGLAFAIDDGLISPPIMGSDKLDLAGLARARRDAGEAVRAGTVSAAALAEVTFTISNLGPFGIDRFTALVVPPQAGIIAVGSTRADGGLTLSLSCDHRVVDGAPGAEFLATVAAGLEEPAWMLELGGGEVAR